MSIGKDVLISHLPKGDIWDPKPDGQLDKSYNADGESIDVAIEQARQNAYVRCPTKTPILDDLELDYGILKNELLSENNRRTQLKAKIYRSPGGGSRTDLQEYLDNAGFNLQVHENNPAVNPALFLTQNFQMVAGGATAIAGNAAAYAGLLGGYILANGAMFEQEPAYIMQANGSIAFAGNAQAIAGRFDGLKRTPIEFVVPTNPRKWPFIFFVGGDAERDPVTDELTKIDQGFVPSERRLELETIILSVKPLFTWAGMIITYT